MIRATTMITAATFLEWAQVIGALLAVGVAGLVAFMPYARRPKLTIEEERDRANSRVESSKLGGLPHVRLLVSNARGVAPPRAHAFSSRAIRRLQPGRRRS
jgi:hypothetical protein